jgi:hypothetical protein
MLLLRLTAQVLDKTEFDAPGRFEPATFRYGGIRPENFVRPRICAEEKAKRPQKRITTTLTAPAAADSIHGWAYTGRTRAIDGGGVPQAEFEASDCQ